jgi:prepilin-type N-terminal cleavage/methylation domain-containing protein/prepilin-type processing-associated H-X9-DG protein
MMRRYRGFTLVELLVVIAIIGILVGLLLPAVQAAREAARRMQCSNNLKQLGLAAHNYHDSHRKFPLGQHLFGNTAGGIARGLGYNWSYALLPYIEQGNLYNQFNNQRPVFENTATRNGALAGTPLASFSCPSDTKPPTIDLTSEAIRPAATSSYKAVNGAYNNGYSSLTNSDPNAFNGTFERDSRAVYGINNLTDGTSNTVIFAETKWGMNASKRTRTYIYGASDPTTTWASGASECSFVNGQTAMNWVITVATSSANRTAGSFHSGGAQFAFGDGSVHFLSENIDHSASGYFAAAPYMQGATAPRNTMPFGTYQRLFAVADGQVTQPFQ